MLDLTAQQVQQQCSRVKQQQQQILTDQLAAYKPAQQHALRRTLAVVLERQQHIFAEQVADSHSMRKAFTADFVAAKFFRELLSSAETGKPLYNAVNGALLDREATQPKNIPWNV